MSQLNVLVERVEDEDGISFYADCLDTPGAWGDGTTEQEALDCYCRVVADWIWLKTQDGDDDIPPLDVTFSAARAVKP